MRRFIPSRPLPAAALAGAAAGLVVAVLLLRFGDPPGGTLTRSNQIFFEISVPARAWHDMVFGWTWSGRRTAEFLTILPLNGALWAMGLTAAGRQVARGVRERRIVLGSVDAGSALAVLVWISGMPITGAWDGVRGLILLAQCPGILLLAMCGYDPYWWHGTVAGDLFRPAPGTLLWLSLANALLIAAAVRMAGWTWRWMRMPMPRAGHLAAG